MAEPDLDDKLRQIDVYVSSEDIYTPLDDDAIAQVKIAFEESGYEKTGEVGRLYGVEITSINGDSNIMTGQEFYNRFKNEWAKDDGFRPDSPLDKYISKIAKRAAGLDKD